jgi:glycosyltransferase involved in cell wall biosynthesis
MKGITVILPTLNRTDFLKQTLDYLVVQEFEHPFEIIIVDQSSTEDEIIKKFSNEYDFIKYYYIESFRGLPEARNFGWQQSSYDYILYLDDDITCKPNLLSEHYKFLKNPKVGVVAGGITEQNNPNSDARTGYFNYFKAEPISGFNKKGAFNVTHAKGCNFSTKKNLLDNVYGVDEHLTKGAALYEELDFCLRVKKTGYQVFFNSEAHVFHLAAETGGCRVPDIHKYIYSLVRNRSFMITRHLKWYHKITAHMYLLKLVLAYAVSYKKIQLFANYLSAKKEGMKLGKQPVKLSYFEK